MQSPALSDEELYLRLQHLIAEMPEALNEGSRTLAWAEWLGKALYVVEQFATESEFEAFESAVGEDVQYPGKRSFVPVLMYRFLAKAEAKAPIATRGGFIPVGKPLDAMASVARLLGDAKSDVLVIDPYAEASLLTDFLSAAPEKVPVRVLSDDKAHKPTLKPAAERWVRQFGVTRPLEVRLAPGRVLHDRLIFVDQSEVWVLGQSFNNLAVRSPTSLLKADPELAKMKIDAYDQIWVASTPL